MRSGHYSRVYAPSQESRLSAHLQECLQRLEQIERAHPTRDCHQEGPRATQLEERVSTLEQLMLYTLAGQWTSGLVSSMIAPGDPAPVAGESEMPAAPIKDKSLAYL